MEIKNIVRLQKGDTALCVFRSDDEAVSLYLKWLNDPDILWRLGRNSAVISEHDVKQKFSNPASPTDRLFNIVNTSTDELVGVAELRRNPGDTTAAIFMCIGDKENRSRGMGFAATRLLMKHAFEDCRVHRLKAKAVTENEAAARCLQNAGFSRCGVDREAFWAFGRWFGMTRFEILEKDYFGIVRAESTYGKTPSDTNRYLATREESLRAEREEQQTYSPNYSSGYGDSVQTEGFEKTFE